AFKHVTRMGAMPPLSQRQGRDRMPGRGAARPLACPARPVHNLRAEGEFRDVRVPRRVADTRRPAQRDIQKPDPDREAGARRRSRDRMVPGSGARSMLLRILDRLEETLIATLMAAATLLIFISVLHRYGSGISFLYPIMHQIHLSWAQELCIYMFIWMAKFGAAYGVRTGIHVGVDVLINQLSENIRAYV